MNIKNAIRAGILAFGVGLALVSVAQPADQPKPRVVFQVSDGDSAKWNLALNNAKNVQQEYGADKVQIEIVAYGPGISMLKADSTASNRVTEAAQAGIEIVACQNTMAAQKLMKADMNTSINYVPAGVVELMKRQAQGWAYIRP
jgi:intracellular sulfur oxidation DsrE/DsrF family protein